MEEKEEVSAEQRNYIKVLLGDFRTFITSLSFLVSRIYGRLNLAFSRLIMMYYSPFVAQV